MEEAFWRDKWATGQIGFHEGAPNALLRKYGAKLGEGETARGLRVLVPLCGKSADLAFLSSAGFAVTGVELVRDAAAAFFSENGVSAREEPWQGFPSLVGAGIRIATGNVFSLALPPAERFDVAYDRAALVAMKPEDRERYVGTLLAALRPGARLLLVSFHYEGGKMTGPPFSVSHEEVRRLFSSCEVDLLESQDITDSEPRFRERGATFIAEDAWLITKPAA
ncbi:MAG TPA: hypothetical protein VHE30_29650 [Polyangiaceae bacterium]|nr:hypothetical protein [Polyangiaceae bacterium]